MTTWSTLLIHSRIQPRSGRAYGGRGFWGGGTARLGGVDLGKAQQITWILKVILSLKITEKRVANKKGYITTKAGLLRNSLESSEGASLYLAASESIILKSQWQEYRTGPGSQDPPHLTTFCAPDASEITQSQEYGLHLWIFKEEVTQDEKNN